MVTSGRMLFSKRDAVLLTRRLKREVTRDKAIIVTDTLLIRVSCSFSFPIWTKDNNNDDNDNDDEERGDQRQGDHRHRHVAYQGVLLLQLSHLGKE